MYFVFVCLFYYISAAPKFVELTESCEDAPVEGEVDGDEDAPVEGEVDGDEHAPVEGEVDGDEDADEDKLLAGLIARFGRDKLAAMLVGKSPTRKRPSSGTLGPARKGRRSGRTTTRVVRIQSVCLRAFDRIQSVTSHYPPFVCRHAFVPIAMNCVNAGTLQTGCGWE